MKDYTNHTTQELLDLVTYGLNAAKEMTARENLAAAETITKNVCDMMDEVYRRQASVEL